MIRTLRAFFLGRLLREKLLLVAFAALGVLMWLSGFGRRATKFWQDQRATTVALKEQSQWLTNRVVIEAAAHKAAAQLDAAKTLDGTRLLAEVNAMAAANGLQTKSTIGGLTHQSSGQFAVNTLNYTVRDADWDALKKFYLALHQRSPYIGIELFTLQSSTANQAQLSLSLRVSSVEITR
jgi:hypothetical protein